MKNDFEPMSKPVFIPTISTEGTLKQPIIDLLEPMYDLKTRWSWYVMKLPKEERERKISLLDMVMDEVGE